MHASELREPRLHVLQKLQQRSPGRIGQPQLLDNICEVLLQEPVVRLNGPPEVESHSADLVQPGQLLEGSGL